MPKSNEKASPEPKKNSGYFARLALKITPDWITPNMLSVLRLIMIPIIISYLALGFYKSALALFVLAALLDALDGILARGRQQISDLGLILDPLADKLLIITIIGFLLLSYPFKLLIIYVFVFDFLILLAGAVKVSQPKTEAAPIRASNLWGKSKMLTQVVGVSLALAWLACPIAPILYASALVIWLSLGFQIASAVSYA